MAYNKFKKIAQLRAKFGIIDMVATWLPEKLPPFPVSNHLLETLLDSKEEALGTEKAKSEYIVAPILKELRKHNPNKFTCFSGYQFDVAPELDLKGYCDFILSAHPKKIEIDAPIICLVEAKNDNIEKGVAQCGAEMYAAQLFNANQQAPLPVIYGVVTTAFSWAFLKLEGKNLTIDPNYVPLTFTEPDKVLAALQWLIEQSLKHVM